MRSHSARSIIIATLALVMAMPVLGIAIGPARAATSHGPILIRGNSDFGPANGVVSGSGTSIDPYIIAGWDIDATSTDGIVVRNTTASFVIRGVTIHSGGTSRNGIVFQNVTAARIENSTVSYDASGILVSDSSDIALFANAVTLNTWDGIGVFDSRRITMNGNNVTYNRDGVYLNGVSELLFQGNGVWLNAQDGAFLTNVTSVRIEGSTFASNAWAGLHISSASNASLLANLAFSNSRDGISIDSIEGLQVRTNTAFSNQGGGIRLYSVSNATVSFNDLSANRDSGIVLEGSRSVTVFHNIASASGYGGIMLGSDADIVVDGNWVTNSDHGLSLILVSRALVRFNNVTQCAKDGIYFAGSDNLTVEKNNASRNGNGVAVETTFDATFRGNVIMQNDYGIYLFRSRRTVVAGNRIVTNAVQAFDEAGPENRWDDGYPSGGNFWSDYRGLDRCEAANQSVCDNPDGIGDTPYYVDTDTTDRYPLMRPPGSPDAPPVASFAVLPATGNTTTSFLLDATTAYDVEDTVAMLELRWDFNGDGTWDTPWTHVRRVAHVFAADGEYEIRLEVRDSSGQTATTTRHLSVRAAPILPLISIDPFVLSLLVLVGSTLALGTVFRRRIRRKVRRFTATHAAWLRPRGR